VIDAAAGVGEPEPGVTLLPVGAIASDGPTFTVRLFSRGPIAGITRVAADTDSHTSVVLMRVLLKRMHGIDVEVVDFDARERVVLGRPSSGAEPLRETALRARAHKPSSPTGSAAEPASPPPPGGEDPWPEAVLLIGDKVVTDAPPAERYPHQMDLGAAWKELTGLPFVYAVWMCRAGEEGSAKVRAAAAVLDRARRHNGTRLGWIVEGRAAEKGWPRDLAATYLGEYLHYGVGDAEREAVEKFVRWAGEMGVVGGGGVRWAGGESANCKVQSTK
jgi:chorismate dehydratase